MKKVAIIGAGQVAEKVHAAYYQKIRCLRIGRCG